MTEPDDHDRESQIGGTRIRRRRKQTHGGCLHPYAEALLEADLVYNQAHLCLLEKQLESRLARLDELETYAKNRVTTIHPGHGKAATLELIGRPALYLHDFTDAVKS